VADIDIEGTISTATRSAVRRAFGRWHVPVVADFDIGWVNQGTATATDIAGKGIQFSDTLATGDRPRWLMKTAPAPPYTVELIFFPATLNTNWQQIGVAIRDGASGRGLTLIQLFDTTLNLGSQRWSSATAWNSNSHFFTNFAQFPFRVTGLRIIDDGTNHTVQYSVDSGETWLSYGSTRSRTLYLANPNQVGVFINNILQLGSFSLHRCGMMIRSFRVF
jgi:hypothetical protein